MTRAMNLARMMVTKYFNLFLFLFLFLFYFILFFFFFLLPKQEVCLELRWSMSDHSKGASGLTPTGSGCGFGGVALLWCRNDMTCEKRTVNK